MDAAVVDDQNFVGLSRRPRAHFLSSTFNLCIQTKSIFFLVESHYRDSSNFPALRYDSDRQNWQFITVSINEGNVKRA